MSNKQFEDFVKTSMDRLLKEANLDWERTARSLGWPDEAISKVKVINGADGYTVYYDEQDLQDINDLEYGNGAAPKAAIRTLSRKYGPLTRLTERAVAEALTNFFSGTPIGKAIR